MVVTLGVSVTGRTPGDYSFLVNSLKASYLSHVFVSKGAT